MARARVSFDCKVEHATGGGLPCRFCELLPEAARAPSGTRFVRMFRSDDWVPAATAYACEEHVDAVAAALVLEAEARELDP